MPCQQLIYRDYHIMHFPLPIVCEGKSERVYLTNLNKILISQDGRQPFNIKSADGCQIKKLLQAAQELKKKDRKACDIYFLVDEDNKFKADWLSGYNNQMKPFQAFFRFNVMNFEDVIMLHESFERLQKWISLMQSRNHFVHPLTDQNYSPCFLSEFPDYVKGEMPFDLDRIRVEQAFSNHKQQRLIHSDFLIDLEKMINAGELLWR